MDKKHRTLQIGINGMGTIGRLVYRMLRPMSGVKVVKVNDLAPKATLEYLLKHDTVHGKWHGQIKDLEYSDEQNPKNVFWNGIDIVVDSTPSLNSYERLAGHLENGAGFVIRTSPLKDDTTETQTVILGINDQELDLEKYKVISLASCTTNCLAPIVKVVKGYCRATGNEMKKINFVTVHAKTNDQATKDSYHKDARRGRDDYNIIETSTGASSQIGLIFPELVGKIHGTAYRVPVSDGSVLEVRIEARKPIDVEKLNAAFREASKVRTFEDILSYETLSLVSSDAIGDQHTCIYLEASAMQLDDCSVKLGALYDNELAYAARVVDLIKRIETDVYKAERKLFSGYENQMSIETWCFDPSPGACDDISELSKKGKESSLKHLAQEEENWNLEEYENGGYLLHAPNFTYFVELTGNEMSMYDRNGSTIDLSKDKDMHMANKAVLSKYVGRNLAQEAEDEEWERSLDDD